MKQRIGKPEVQEILTQVVGVDGFEELEGWDKETAIALAKFLQATKQIQAKHTSSIFLAWQELSSKERQLLEQNIGKHAIAMVGIVFSAFLSRVDGIKEALAGKGGLLDFLKFLESKGKGKIIDGDNLPPDLKRALDRLVRESEKEGE